MLNRIYATCFQVFLLAAAWTATRPTPNRLAIALAPSPPSKATRISLTRASVRVDFGCLSPLIAALCTFLALSYVPRFMEWRTLFRRLVHSRFAAQLSVLISLIWLTSKNPHGLGEKASATSLCTYLSNSPHRDTRTYPFECILLRNIFPVIKDLTLPRELTKYFSSKPITVFQISFIQKSNHISWLIPIIESVPFGLGA